MKKIFKSIEVYCIIGILICFSILHYGQIRVENVVLRHGNAEKQTTLPISQNMDAGEWFNVRFSISNPLNIPYDLNIIPDDCAESMTVNGFAFFIERLFG